MAISLSTVRTCDAFGLLAPERVLRAEAQLDVRGLCADPGQHLAGQIDDRQAGVPHAEMTRDKGPLIIGSAMGQTRDGGLQGRDPDGGATIEEADDAAHEANPLKGVEG